MDRKALLDSFDTEWAGLLAITRSATDRLPALVPPGCAPMTGEELFLHLGRIYRTVAEWITGGSRPHDAPTCPDGLSAIDWARRECAALIDLLRSRDPADPAPSRDPLDRTIGFWNRRMAHETAVHRVDFAQALSRPWTIDDALAIDGIDEAVTFWLATRLGRQVDGSGRIVEITTGGRSWWLHPMDRLIDYPVGGPADATVTGSPAAVWCWIWGRPDPSHPISISGDASAADEIRALFARTMG